jgi:RNA polymerase sigma-70 factor (ECF subfamily)
VPAGLGAPETDWAARARAAPAETRWLQPLPVDPAEATAVRQRIRLAFVAALQHLPARQRAVLILRDVADLPAAEVATILGTTTVAVNSALLRARERLSRVAPDPDVMSEPAPGPFTPTLARYVEAFERADVAALAAVLREDVTLEMPPHATWFAGRVPVLGFLGTHVLREPGAFAMRPVATPANGQPTFAMYAREQGGGWHAHALHVLDVDPAGIRRVHIFLQPELFAMFGRPTSSGAGRDLPD